MNIHISQLRWYNFHLVFEGRQLVKSFELTCFFRRCRKIHQAGDRFPSDVRWPDWYPSWRIISWCESCQTTFSRKENVPSETTWISPRHLLRNYSNSPVWYRESAWNVWSPNNSCQTTQGVAKSVTRAIRDSVGRIATAAATQTT